MKFTLFYLLAVMAVVFSAPSSEETDDMNVIVNLSDNDFMQRITENIEMARGKARQGSGKAFVSILANSLDKKCMLNQYLKHNITDMIPRKDMMQVEGFERELSQIVFMDAAVMCSSKLYALLDYTFENLMTHRILVEAFIEDPEMKEYKEMLTCANNYAVKNGIMDPQVYDLKHELTSEMDELCEDYVEQAKYTILSFKMMVREEFNRSCSAKIVSKMEKLVLKNMLLLQVDLADDQKRMEKKMFVKNVRQILEDIMKCAAQEPSKMRSDS
jgi:hypothetical protein